MTSFAQGQTPSASPAPSKTSDLEIRKTLVRSLDTILVQKQIIAAKDAVIEAQDKALVQSEAATEGYKKAFTATDLAYTKQKEATISAESGWKDSEERVRKLEKSLRKSDNKVKWMAVGAVATIVSIFLLK